MVEGVEDQELLAALLVKLGKVGRWDETGRALRGTTAGGNQVALYEMGGWTTLPTSKLLPQLQQSPEVGVLNLVVYDADTTSHERGGFEARRGELQGQAAALGLAFELFLFPTNHADGNLETLLESLIHPGHQQVVDCFTKYEDCLQGLVSPNGLAYRIPADKAKIYAYVEAMPLTDEERRRHKGRGATKYFSNPAYWNLDSAEVQPLCEFLNQHIQ